MTCPHGDHPACCVDCLEGPPPEQPNRPEQLEAETGPFPARFAGHCSGCNLAIHEGQTIRRMTNGEYRHGRCT